MRALLEPCVPKYVMHEETKCLLVARVEEKVDAMEERIITGKQLCSMALQKADSYMY